jgi:hypothetical protein
MFVGRAREIRRIVGRITSGGQSVAITAEPGMGKDSLLRLLSAPEKRVELYGELTPRLVFQYIDATTFGSAFTQPQFWWLALSPLAEKLKDISNPALSAAFDICEKESFGVYVLEKFFAQLQSAGWRLVLLLDEFDTLLTHPVLNKSEFYGGMRSLASRYESLTLITASRQPLEKLNEATQEFSRMGSPYFNFMSQISLGAFSDKDAHTLLSRGDEHFTKADKDFLLFIAGGHPALLQASAYSLWEAYEDGEPDRQIRWEITSRDLLEAAKPILSNTWHVWTPEARKAVTIIALDSIPRLVASKEFDIEALIGSLQAYSPEIDELKKRGFLVPDGDLRSGYRLQAQVMLWWLAGELIRVTRPQGGNDLGSWLNSQQWDGIIKANEKSQLLKALTSLGGLLKVGAEAFIKASAEGFAKGLTGAK